MPVKKLCAIGRLIERFAPRLNPADAQTVRWADFRVIGDLQTRHPLAAGEKCAFPCRTVDAPPQTVDGLDRNVDASEQTVDAFGQTVDVIPWTVDTLNEPVDELPRTVDAPDEMVDALPRPVDGPSRTLDALPRGANRLAAAPLTAIPSAERPASLVLLRRSG
ncbi:MAG TPA: hypothetical protein VGR35_16770 [Tepidisphaeraceae bacterium]|nr:hypothetical protein [Tepidisphaeraceae bacterium]